MAGSARPVRVRFAPSPTGHLHVGGARTALFNWLFARHHGGTFVLRIEDTDVERSTAESETSLIDDLSWLGLDWQEGPDVAGGHGPYRQSERLALYGEHARRFVDVSLAYPCFCSDAVLQAKKERASKEGGSPHYDGTCRDLSAAEVAKRRAAHMPEVIRFRVPPGTVRVDDVVRGQVEFDTAMVGDFVLLRSNGRPTYNFAAALDDHLMGMTHVLRGEEHLPNTLRQVLVYRALGAEPPVFGHLPLILAEDRSKLSKRHGASSVGELRSMGFLPGAVVNYLVLLGWSHPRGEEVIELSELISTFSLDRINKSAAVYDRAKLGWMNGQYIRRQSIEELAEVAEPFVPEWMRAQYDDRQRRDILHLLQEKIETLADLQSATAPFKFPFAINDEAAAVLRSADSATVLAALRAALEKQSTELTADAFKTMMKQIAKDTGIKGKSLFFPVRAALTGSVHGPDLGGLAAIKGRDTLLDLVVRAQSL